MQKPVVRLDSAEFNHVMQWLQKVSDNAMPGKPAMVDARALAYALKVARVDEPMNRSRVHDYSMRELFPNKMPNLLYYNYDEGKLNRNTYLGCDITKQYVDKQNADKVKDVLEGQAWYGNKYELAALVVMAADWFPAACEPVRDNYVSFDAKSNKFVGTIVSRDLSSGNLVVPVHWMGSHSYMWRMNAVQNAMTDFAQALIMRPETLMIFRELQPVRK